MKAAVYYGKKDLRIEEVDYPECPPGGVILKPKYVGICGGDVRNYYQGTHKIKPPMVTGHEFAGEIVETSKDHDKYQVGDRLAGAPIVYCGTCLYCQNNMITMCENLREIGFQFPGGFQEYMPITKEAFERGLVVPMPEGLSYKHAALFEPPSSCIYAQERADITVGDKVAIFGAGPIGCMHIQIAKLRGASRVIMIDISKERLEMSKTFGADEYIDGSTTDVPERVKEIVGSCGVNKVIVAAPSTAAIEQSLEIVQKRAVIILFGGMVRGHSIANLDANIIHYNDISVVGHFGQERRHVILSLELIQEGKISADKLITHILPLEKILEGFELVADKKALKVLIQPNK